MKTSHASDRSRNEPASKNYVSWSKDAQAQLLRVELADGSFCLFPFAHLSFVKCAQQGEGDLLTLRFANHEIQITGKRLRELGLAVQKLAVDWVKEQPARYATMANQDEVLITAIKVSELQAPQ
jgi:hypothetical protein